MSLVTTDVEAVAKWKAWLAFQAERLAGSSDLRGACRLVLINLAAEPHRPSDAYDIIGDGDDDHVA